MRVRFDAIRFEREGVVEGSDRGLPVLLLHQRPAGEQGDGFVGRMALTAQREPSHRIVDPVCRQQRGPERHADAGILRRLQVHLLPERDGLRVLPGRGKAHCP